VGFFSADLEAESATAPEKQRCIVAAPLA